MHKTVLRIVTANLRMFVSRGVNAADRTDKKKRGRAAARNSQTPSDEGNKQQ
ncbi:hypothetical protein [Burkholderia dolosa]|uniref:hypothetical protein n=1 Tax=Burkholderia dolosa TaxID=152500 RepID=UPI001ABB7029|nr:hypothetical protein [Burkholderia dolosa]MBY4750627.1 hypothetical protein [Burkholderia dolosa]